MDLVPAASGWLTPAADSGLDIGSALAGRVEIQRETVRHGRFVGGRAGSSRSPTTRCSQRSSRPSGVQLGEEAVLLAHSQLVGPLDQLLARVARPGFRSTTEIPGLPVGWCLYDGVQILSSIS